MSIAPIMSQHHSVRPAIVLPSFIALMLLLTQQSQSADPPDSLTGRPYVTCHTWAIADGESGEVLWGEEMDTPRKSASTTKMMCAYVILSLAEENPDVLDETVTFSQLADDTSGSTADVRVGEQVVVRECLYGLLLPSGNDAGNALAEHFNDRFEPPEYSQERTNPVTAESHPTRANFIAEMNRAAERLGMTNTFYRSSYGDGGEEDDRTTTARDLLILAHAALKNPRFAEYVSTAQYETTVTTPEGDQRPVAWTNTNQLLGIEGYDGVKTGTTNQARQCLVSSGRRGDDHLLMAVLGSADRYVDSRNLYRWAWLERGHRPSSSILNALDQAIASRQVGETREESGSLETTDDTLETGEYFDEFSFTANEGDVFVIDLFSSDFDPYLILLNEATLSDFQLDNDDFGSGDITHSQIIFVAPSTSTYSAVATSFDPGVKGDYQLTIRNVTPETPSNAARRKENGTLQDGDEQLDEGEFVDVYSLSAEAGDLLVIDLRSNDFDTYLFVTGPDGSEFEIRNDDFGSSTSHSQVTMIAPVSGEYIVHMTTFEAGETGDYELKIRDL